MYHGISYEIKSIPATFLHSNASAFIHSVFCAGLPFPDCKKQSLACNTHFSISNYRLATSIFQ